MARAYRIFGFLALLALLAPLLVASRTLEGDDAEQQVAATRVVEEARAASGYKNMKPLIGTSSSAVPLFAPREPARPPAARRM